MNHLILRYFNIDNYFTFSIAHRNNFNCFIHISCQSRQFGNYFYIVFFNIFYYIKYSSFSPSNFITYCFVDKNIFGWWINAFFITIIINFIYLRTYILFICGNSNIYENVIVVFIKFIKIINRYLCYLFFCILY
jgi:hypothetical protein